MIEKIIEYSIRNRFLVILATAAVVVWGVYSVLHTPVDAIPDLSENQVIVFTDWMGRSPREIEDQITYPLSVNLQGLAGVKAVRSSSEFNFSMINVIFEDNIDFYFARQRVLERLTLAATILPAGVVPYMAPDATALGQIFWYTVEGSGQDLGRLRALQDWYLRYELKVPGVADVASVGGYPIEYQIDVDPTKLRAYGVTLGELYNAVARSNSAVGGRVIQKGNAEYIVRGVGWIRSSADIEAIVVKTNAETGTPVSVANLASVSLGSEFRRSVLEKNGNEAVGAVVMMRHGENPLEVTQRIKDKIVQLQGGLPPGVRIVPFYDRTRLIEGAIHSLTETLTHEIIIASIAILLILWHFRSAVLICMTLPLAVLVSFILMRYFQIPSNIMSLSGIAISIGVLVDQAIVMVENATHHLTAHFGQQRVTGDIRELVIPACRTVGRPIFFSVMIILISFIPVFALSGREGKTFHPLAFTKSFAMIGVALISITLVPALIPWFVRGRLRSENENWLVRSLIAIYKPLLSWALDRRNLVMWSFAAILILGAGLFPLDAVLGFPWHNIYLAVVAVTVFFTVIFIEGIRWQAISFVSLAALSLWAYNFPKIGVEYMPPLDEGSILDMPVTVPRVSITQAADDLKARDALLREFPEVEQVVGKAGRADTPTDPAPLEMIETVVNLRPKEEWFKRQLRFVDAEAQMRVLLAALQERKCVQPLPSEQDRKALLDPAVMSVVALLDDALRPLALQHQQELEAQMGPKLVRALAAEVVGRWREAGLLRQPVDDARLDALSGELSAEFAPVLLSNPAIEDMIRFTGLVARRLAEQGAVQIDSELMVLHTGRVQQLLAALGSALGREPPTLYSTLRDFVGRHREQLWQESLRSVNYALFDCAVSTLAWHGLDELRKEAKRQGFWIASAPAQQEDRQLHELQEQLSGPLGRELLLWQKTKDNLLEEMRTVVQMPGWSNIFTQPIVNRIQMLATGVRTDIGVRVFGDDLDQIQKVADQVADVLRTIPGATDVTPDRIKGKGYLEITIDRQKAARLGVNVGDIQDVIEVALGGKAITMTVEKRERFPVRIRYARSWRQDEEQVKNLLVTAGGGMSESNQPGSAGGMSPGAATTRRSAAPRQIPLSMVADVRIVEGPGMIKSENGRLAAYVQLNVAHDHDMVGFAEEAQRAVQQRVKLPQRTNLQWSGEFEHQIHARKTLQLIVPLVVLLIFVILYLTYHDLLDAVLMMMAVPEALVGGVFFLWLAGDRFSVAVQVGFIACFGMATETGIIMLVYLREAIQQRGGLEKIASLEELRQAVIEGAVHRLRPKLLTEGVAIIALAPMLWASGVGHEVISAMAAPVLGGLLVSDEVVDIFIPVRFYWIRRYRWLKLHKSEIAKHGEPPGL